MNHISNYFFSFTIKIYFFFCSGSKKVEFGGCDLAIQPDVLYFFSNKMALPVEMSLFLACQSLLIRLHQSFWLASSEQTQTCSRWLSLPALLQCCLGAEHRNVLSQQCLLHFTQTRLPRWVRRCSEKMVMKFWTWLPWFNLYGRSAVPVCEICRRALSEGNNLDQNLG